MKRASLLVALCLTALPVAFVTGPLPLACAGEGPDVALIVDTGSAVHKMCVALDAERVSGIDVIELAASQHGLDYKLGYGGQGVCRLANVGTDAEECFKGGEPFWGYWRSNGSGGWTWSGTGAGSTSVEDGDVEGWSWGTGNDASSHQAPPVTSHESVCGAEPQTKPPKKDPAKKDPPDRKRERKPHSDGGARKADDAPGDEEGAPGGTVGSEEDDDAAPESPRVRAPSKKRERGKDLKRGARADSTPRPLATSTPISTPNVTDDATPSLDATATSREDEGPPVAGVLALLVASALGVAGAVVVRRRGAGRG